MKIRCSSIGKIMTNSRSKTETLSKTCRTYLQELAVEEMYGKRKEFSSKYTDKGNQVEDDGIKLCESVLDSLMTNLFPELIWAVVGLM